MAESAAGDEYRCAVLGDEATYCWTLTRTARQWIFSFLRLAAGNGCRRRAASAPKVSSIRSESPHGESREGFRAATNTSNAKCFWKALREKIMDFNATHSEPETARRVIAYVGQTVLGDQPGGETG